MYIYDAANQLAESIKESNEYKNFKNAKDKLFSDPEKKKEIEEFEKLKQELQIMEVKQQNKQEVDQIDKKNKLEKMYNVLVENKDIKEYFDYEISFNQMIYDINKIIGNAIKELM